MAVAALSPEARFQGARPIPIRSEVLLPADTSGVYPWAEAGRAAGRLAIEGLLRAAGDLTPEQRLALAPAVRSGSNAP